MGHQRQNQNQLNLLIAKESPSYMYWSPYLSHTSPVFYKLKTLTVFDINSLQSLLFMFKYLYNMLALSFQNFYTMNNSIHSYPTPP